MKRIYKTNRLTLRTVDSSFASRVLNYYERNKYFLEPWEPKKESYFYTLDYHMNTLITESDRMADLSLLRLWIFKREDIHFRKIIGTVSYSNIVRGAFQSCFIGYKLDKDHLNRGYMTEAVDRSIDVMFHDYNLHRIEANIMPKNTASLKVVEKLGFENEGLGKKYLKINGVWEDHLHMVLLNNACD